MLKNSSSAFISGPTGLLWRISKVFRYLSNGDMEVSIPSAAAFFNPEEKTRRYSGVFIIPREKLIIKL